MAIDLRNVEPLASKSRLGGTNGSLLEQALKRHQNGRSGASKFYDDMDIDDSEAYNTASAAIGADLQWIKEDKTALQSLVQQMDATMTDLRQQVQQAKSQTIQTRHEIEKEQQLLFKQIHTLNGLLKKQVDLYSVMEKKMLAMDIRQGPVWQQVAVGVIAGLVSAVSLVALSPVAASFMQGMISG